MTSIREAIAAMDEEAEDWEEINGEDGAHSVKQYENHEDRILDFADTAETWIRAALEVLTPAQIHAVDAKVWPDPDARKQYVVTFTSMVIEADDEEQAIDKAGDFKGGGNWEAAEVHL